MRLRVTLIIPLIAFVAAQASAAPLQAVIDAYHAQVSDMTGRALMAELLKHPELLQGTTTKFSYRIDPAGHPSDIKAVSTPRNRFVERTILRVISGLKYPSIPKRILQEGGYKSLEFESEMGPPHQ